MKIFVRGISAVVAAFILLGSSYANEAQVALYLVEKGADDTETYYPYAPGAPHGPHQHLVAFAKGPADTTVVMIAFSENQLYRNLAPVIQPQTAEHQPARFPSVKQSSEWSYSAEDAPAVDFYVGVFANHDTKLEKIREYGEWLQDALNEGDTDSAALHALAIRNRLSQILRTRSAQDYVLKHGVESPVSAPAPKAAITRGSVTAASQAPVVKGLRLSELEGKWEGHSHPFPVSIEQPGLKLIQVNARVNP